MSLKDKIYFYICFWLIFIIHSIDMILTTVHIGNNYSSEDNPAMRYCMVELGLSNAIWISRLTIFALLFLALQLQERKWVQHLMFLGVLFYIACQWNWPFYLGWCDYPFKCKGIP